MYFVLHAEDVLNSKNAKKLQEAPQLMRELIVAVAKDANNISHHSVSPLRMLTVSELRKELAKLGLSVSGSKEVLISRLQGSSE
ncbi:hypothetical protein HJC23_001873 [Cyclotella cryptica]|uniref:SAP domain-containing protein n=1 Tax=Cyclotella cryptica TaxID=29204 RepID=A0ABD3PLW6_9STRA